MTSWSTRRHLNTREKRNLADIGKRYNDGLALMRQARAAIDAMLLSYDGEITQHELADALGVDRNVVREAKSRIRKK